MRNNKNFQILVAHLQKSPPVIIQLYPLEVVFVCFALLHWLTVHPGSQTVRKIFKRLQEVLNHHFPQLQNLVAAVLTSSLGHNR